MCVCATSVCGVLARSPFAFTVRGCTRYSSSTFLPAPSMEYYLPWKVVCTPHPRTHYFSHHRSPHPRQGKIGLSLGHIVMRGAAFAGRV